MNKRKVEMNVVDIISVFVSEGCFAKWIPKNSAGRVLRPGFQVPSQAPQLRHCEEAILQSFHPAERVAQDVIFSQRGQGFLESWERPSFRSSKRHQAQSAFSFRQMDSWFWAAS